MRAILALHQDLADRVEELEKITDYHGQKFGVASDLLKQIMSDPKISETENRFCRGNEKEEMNLRNADILVRV